MTKDKAEQHVYTVKIMNASKKSEFTVQKLEQKCVYDDLQALKIMINFPGESELGFIQPGHGFKGKQNGCVQMSV